MWSQPALRSLVTFATSTPSPTIPRTRGRMAPFVPCACRLFLLPEAGPSPRELAPAITPSVFLPAIKLREPTPILPESAKPFWLAVGSGLIVSSVVGQFRVADVPPLPGLSWCRETLSHRCRGGLRSSVPAGLAATHD